jgi:hypothetical protein
MSINTFFHKFTFLFLAPCIKCSKRSSHLWKWLKSIVIFSFGPLHTKKFTFQNASMHGYLRRWRVILFLCYHYFFHTFLKILLFINMPPYIIFNSERHIWGPPFLNFVVILYYFSDKYHIRIFSDAIHLYNLIEWFLLQHLTSLTFFSFPLVKSMQMIMKIAKNITPLPPLRNPINGKKTQTDFSSYILFNTDNLFDGFVTFPSFNSYTLYFHSIRHFSGQHFSTII